MSNLEQTIDEVSAAIKAHAEMRTAPFSSTVLSNVLAELRKMKVSADYVPAYPRFLLDWEDAALPLGKNLLNLAYQREQSVKRMR